MLKNITQITFVALLFATQTLFAQKSILVSDSQSLDEVVVNGIKVPTKQSQTDKVITVISQEILEKNWKPRYRNWWT